MWELDHKGGWAQKNWWFWTLMLEKTLENPLDSKEIKPVNPKGNQPWMFLGRTDAQAEAPKLSTTDSKSQLIGKDPDAGKNWEQEDKRVTEDEMVEWHHRLNGHGFGWSPGFGDGQGGLVWGSWCCKESDMTDDWTATKWTSVVLSLIYASSCLDTLQISALYLSECILYWLFDKKMV